MKRIPFTLLILLVWLSPGRMLAQTVVPADAYITFTAQGSEVFAVYVDGVPSGNITYSGTQQQVLLSNIPSGVHDITVRLIRPSDRIAHVTIDYQYQRQSYLVSYESSTGLLSILTGANTALPTTAAPAVAVVTPTPTTSTTPATEVVVLPPLTPRHMASDADVLGIVERMKKTTFENDKLQLAKSFVKGKHVSTAQAIQIAQALRFESKRLDYLLYAYDYCYDRENYYKAADILNFNSNKQKLLKRIQHSSPNRRPQASSHYRRR